MLWCIVCGMLGLILAVAFIFKSKFNKCGTADVLHECIQYAVCGMVFGMVIGTFLAVISTGVVHLTVPESEYKNVVIDSQEILVSENGEIVLFDIDSSTSSISINFLTVDKKMVNRKINDNDVLDVEFVDSGYRVVKGKKALGSWVDMLIMPMQHYTTVYIPEQAWIDVWASK